MSIQQYNTVKTIARAAAHISAVLPDELAAAIEHLEAITTSRTEAPQPGLMARAVAEHLGNSAAMEKARKAAALELATADARAKIDAFLLETCGTRLRGLMNNHAEEVAAAFGDALSDDLVTLTETAGTLPAWFKPEKAGNLDPDTYRAWDRARAAHERIHAAALAVAPLYGAAIPTEHATEFPIQALTSLRYAEPGRLATRLAAYDFRSAAMGRARGDANGSGPVSIDGLFIPTALAHAGATFEWATPAEVATRARLLVQAMTQPERASAMA